MRRSTGMRTVLAVAGLALMAGFVAGMLHAGLSPRQVAVSLGLDALTGASRPAAAETAAPAIPPQTGSASVLLVGDLLPVTDREYLSGVRQMIRSADLAVCNLECPISSHGRRIPLKLTDAGRVMHNEYFFRAPPAQARRLADAGFDMATLANNHIMDFGGEALLETLALLGEAGVAYTGAGADRVAAREPALTTVRGQRIAVLAYADAATLPATDRFAATDETAGTVFVRGDGSGTPDAASERLIREDVGAAAGAADVVIVGFHWGTEGADEPDRLQRSLARLAVDAGADVVVGHHPHRLQGVEIYRGSPIAYSLGNFAFPTRWESNQFSAALEVRVEDGRWTSLRWHPVRLEHLAGDPRPADGTDAERIVRRIVRLSEALGTTCEVASEPGRVVITARENAPCGEALNQENAFGISAHPELDGMSEVRFLAWDLEGSEKVAKRRSVVVSEKLAAEVLAIFREIYADDARFPIHEVIGYDYRTIAGSQDRLSYHALGRAIDINRAENPMIKGGRKIVHPNEPPYVPGEWRPESDPYSISASGPVVEAFTSRGWRWGGRWTTCKDYQHFDRPP